MGQRSVVVASPVGLHARPVTASGLPVTIRKGDGAPVSAASILAVLTLNVGCGDEVTIEADGDGAEAVLDRLAELLAAEPHPS
jgi:phosphocarrier protein HPr